MARRITSGAFTFFNEKNPQPKHRQFPSRPDNGARRFRPASSRRQQKIVAIAKLSDGSFWSASVEIVVTLAACTDEVDLMASALINVHQKLNVATLSRSRR